MKKNRAKRSSNQSPEKEAKDKPMKKKEPRKSLWLIAVVMGAITIIATLKGLWHEGWLKYVLLPIGLVAIGYWIYEVCAYHFTHRLAPWIISIFGCLVLAVLTSYLYTKNPPQPTSADFSISFTSPFEDPFVCDPARFWLGQNGQIYPANCTAYIRYQNLRSTYHALHSYWVETEVDGKWERVPMLPIQQPVDIYLINGTNFHQARKLEITQTLFDVYIREKNMSPGETVYAWVFWGMPTNGISNKLRFHAHAGTKVSVQPITFIKNDPHVHAPALRFGDLEDVSKFRRY